MELTCRPPTCRVQVPMPFGPSIFSGKGVAWAKYLRKVHCEWNPLKEACLAPLWHTRLTNRKIMAFVPKLEVTKTLLPKSSTADKTHITFADGTEHSIDLSSYSLRDVIEEIETHNGRISIAEAKRGKAF